MSWFVEREDGTRVAGPFTTDADASLARVWVEIVKSPETFWIRSDTPAIDQEDTNGS